MFIRHSTAICKSFQLKNWPIFWKQYFQDWVCETNILQIHVRILHITWREFQFVANVALDLTFYMQHLTNTHQVLTPSHRSGSYWLPDCLGKIRRYSNDLVYFSTWWPSLVTHILIRRTCWNLPWPILVTICWLALEFLEGIPKDRHADKMRAHHICNIFDTNLLLTIIYHICSLWINCFFRISDAPSKRR